MLRKSDGGIDGFRQREDDIDEYVIFLREVVSLVVIERIDLLPRIITEQRQLLLISGDAPEDVDLRNCLQSLRGKTPVAVVLDVVRPLAAIAVSLCALGVSLLRTNSRRLRCFDYCLITKSMPGCWWRYNRQHLHCN